MCTFYLQVKVSFDLNTIQIKYLDEENEEVKYILVPMPRYNKDLISQEGYVFKNIRILISLCVGV